MRRVVTQDVRVELSDEDVRRYLFAAARVPAVHRDEARLESDGNGGMLVLWREPAPRTKSRKDLIDLTGQTIGKWLVLERAPSGPLNGEPRVTRWLCRCDGCGMEHTVSSQQLRNGKTKQCMDCMRQERTVQAEQRRCKFCDAQLKAGSKHASECQSCNRRRHRQGLCKCGYPRYLRKVCPGCGRDPKNPKVGALA